MLHQGQLQGIGACIDTPHLPWSIVISQRWLWGISTVEKMLRNACKWSVTITKTEVVKSEWAISTEPLLPLNLAQQCLERWTWRHFVPFRGEMYHERLGICYKVAYNSTHDGWKARSWGTHWLQWSPKVYSVAYPFIHLVCSTNHGEDGCLLLFKTHAGEWLLECKVRRQSPHPYPSKKETQKTPHHTGESLNYSPTPVKQIRRILQKTVTTSFKVLCISNQIQIT